ncbi:MAG: hypothetical protein DRI57_12065 [Deltaproteobacteria bacterium]|nr:MAG: hypothetical protein DRI57_12065 [Deltaproteobacteria bacterium]
MFRIENVLAGSLNPERLLVPTFNFSRSAFSDYNRCGEAAISKRYLTQSHKEHREKGAEDKSRHIYARLPDQAARIGRNCQHLAQ